jgi:hypothetical protein
MSRASGCLSVTAVLDHHGMAVMVFGDGTRDHEGIPAMVMMPAAMVIERNRAVVTVMQALSILVDDPDLVVVSMVGPDNHIGLGRRGHGRQSHRKRQSAHDHCFHYSFSTDLNSPSVDTTAAGRFGSGVFPRLQGCLLTVEGWAIALPRGREEGRFSKWPDPSVALVQSARRSELKNSQHPACHAVEH